MSRKYAVKVDGKERIVEIDEGAFRVDGAAVDVAVVEAETGVYLLRRPGEQVVAQVDGTGAKTSVALRRGARSWWIAGYRSASSSTSFSDRAGGGLSVSGSGRRQAFADSNVTWISWPRSARAGKSKAKRSNAPPSTTKRILRPGTGQR